MPFSPMLGWAPFLSCVLVVPGAAAGPFAPQRTPPAAAASLAPAARGRGAQQSISREQDALDRVHRLEGEALISLADAIEAGKQVPSDLSISWHNDFLKARAGTFVPFVVTIGPPLLRSLPALLYVRLSSRDAADREALVREAPFAVEEVFPVDARAEPGLPLRIMRGFSAAPGEYDLVVVVRERVDPARPSLPRRTGALSRRLILPDFGRAGLATSSVILADRLTSVPLAAAAEHQSERPYLIGLSDIQPSADTSFRRSEELIVVLLVYSPFVTVERKFDIEVEYHFFRRNAGSGRGGEPPDRVDRPPAGANERYFNQTKPQRFTPATMGARYDPSAGEPLMAGQGVPLASFAEGEYRLVIRVTDVIARKSIQKDVLFNVVP